MAKLNEQLAAMDFCDMVLQINQSKAGLSLEIYGKPGIISASSPLCALRQLQVETCLSVAISRLACNSEPILLFAGPERTIQKSDHRQLANFITNITKTCQCLYSSSDINIFPDDVTARRYRAEDLIWVDA